MNNKKNKFIPGFMLGILSMVILIGSVYGGMFLAKRDIQKISITDQTKDKMDDLKGLIDYYYLETADTNDLQDGVYKGLIYGLKDPYSQYYTKEEYQSFMEESSGIYKGIGALVTENEEAGVVSIVSVFEGSPAEKAGMHGGDIIYKVDDKEVVGETLSDVVSKIKGEKGTKVKVTVYRAKTDEYVDCVITRDEINVPTVSYKMLDKKKKIGYINIIQFDDVTEKQFDKAVKALKKQGIKSVIFDIRDNPGGLYTSVCRILDRILPEGTIVYTEDKYGKKEKQTSDADCLKMPIVVLQNENSASASEIFAGAIQDFGVGTIIGTKSYGKGIVQSIFPLSDGSAVKLTIQKYFTPKGVNIHGKGITPDVEVKDDKKTKEDEVLEKAKDLLLGEDDGNKKTDKKDNNSKKSSKDGKSSKKDKSSKSNKDSKSNKK